MKILITGISGFVGSNLVNFLGSKKIATFYGMDIINPEMDFVEEILGWNKLDNIPNIDAIIHLAGKAHDTKNTSDEQSYFAVNTELTKDIYKHFLKSTASKFIFFSSVKAVADTLNDNVLTEEYIPNPQTAYGKSKLEAEQYILSHKIPEGKKVYIIRPSMIHGPGNKGNLNLLYKLVSKGIPWPLGKYNNQRSFCSIDNLKIIIQELIQSGDIPSGIYNVCDDEALSTNDIIQLIAQSKELPPRIWKVPKIIVQTVSRIGDILHLPLNTERLKKLTENYIVSNSKIKNAIRKSLPVSTSEGLLKTFISFNNNA